MKTLFMTVAVCFLTMSIYSYAYAQQGQKNYHFRNSGKERNFYFDDNKINELPVGFQSAFTGKGEPGRWVIKKIEHAPFRR